LFLSFLSFPSFSGENLTANKIDDIKVTDNSKTFDIAITFLKGAPETLASPVLGGTFVLYTLKNNIYS